MTELIGLGAVFQAAESNLDAGSFTKLTGAFPAIKSLMSANSTEAGSTGGLMGMAMNAVGSVGGLGAAAELAAGFQKAGLEIGMVKKFAPIVMNYLNSNGGDEVKAIVAKLF